MIIRGEIALRDHFFQMPNAFVRDPNLSYKARGLLANLLSHAPGWEVNIDSFVKNGPDGRDAVRSGIQELEKHGYLTREIHRTQGRFANADYCLSDPRPSVEGADVGFAGDGETGAGNPASKNTSSKKTITRNNIVKNTKEGEIGNPHMGEGSRASIKQRQLLLDNYAAANGSEPPLSMVEEWKRLSISEAHAAIKEGRAEFFRAEYNGTLDPDVEGVSAEYRKAAANGPTFRYRR